MYIAPLRLLEVLIVFFLKLWLVFQIPQPIERALNSSAREDHTATMSLSLARLTSFLIGQTGKPS